MRLEPALWGLPSMPLWLGGEPGTLDRALRTVSEQAPKVSAIVDEAHAAGLDGSHPDASS
jgi:hypothetical protein